MSSGNYGTSVAEHSQRELSTHFRCELAGDFYCETDDVVRGVTIPGDETGFGPSQSYGGCPFSKFELLAGSHNPRQEFESTGIPPALSEEVKTYLEATTLQLSNCLPATVGNDLLTFLRERVNAQVEKVNLKKFTIRAEVLVEGFACNVKVKIYQHEQTTFVEFQRRSGDAVAFLKFYHKASGYLQGHSHDQVTSEACGAPETPHVPALPPNEAIRPLLDMVSFNQDANLLAEVASALSAMAKDPMIAAELRKPCAFSVLQQLREVNDFSVAFPTSQVLSCM